MKILISPSAAATFDLGKQLGEQLQPGNLVAFTGDLGAGKTCCIQGIAVGLGVANRSVVTSPTYTIIHEYQGRLPVYHFDVYRLERPEDLYDVGYEEYFYGSGVTVIEWADRISGLLPPEYLAIHLETHPDFTRVIRLQAHGPWYEELLRTVETVEASFLSVSDD